MFGVGVCVDVGVVFFVVGDCVVDVFGEWYLGYEVEVFVGVVDVEVMVWLVVGFVGVLYELFFEVCCCGDEDG